jgi:predicted phage terminase large subunit-like protein
MNTKLLHQNLKANRRRLGKKSPRAFAEIYMPNHCECEFSRLHIEMFQLLEQATEKRKARISIAAPRGHAKSTIVSLIYVLWCILYEKEKLIIIASNTREQAIALLKDIKHQIRNNPLIQADFPEICLGKKPKPWRDSRIQLPNGSMICVYGVGQNPRGIKNDMNRPGLIVCDDLENEEQAESEEQRIKLEKWFKDTLLNTGYPDTNVVVVGTILHQDSLLAKLIDPEKKPGWTGRKYRAIEQFCIHPHHWEQWGQIFNSRDEYQQQTGPDTAKVFYQDHIEQMLEGTQVLWPERESYYDLMVLRQTEGVRSFQREKQNEPLDPQQCIFKQENMVFWDDDYRDIQYLIESMGDDAEFYIGCDPSMGRSDKSDYTAIIVLLKNYETKICYVIAADLSRYRPNEALSKIVEYAKMYDIDGLGIETNNFQQLMVENLEDMLEEKRVRLFDIHEIKSSANKRSRISSLEPSVSQGKLRFSRKHSLLFEQLTQFPVAKYDDGPDALEMAMQASQNSGSIINTFPV